MTRVFPVQNSPGRLPLKHRQFQTPKMNRQPNGEFHDKRELSLPAKIALAQLEASIKGISDQAGLELTPLT